MTLEKFTGWTEKAIRFCYYGLAYFLPMSIAFTESFAGGTIFFFFVKRIGLFLCHFKTTVLSESTFSKRIRKFFESLFNIVRPVPNLLNVPIGIFTLICALSIFQSNYVKVSIEAFFFKLLQWTYLYFVFLECMKTKKHLKIFVFFLLLSFFLVSLSGVVQYFSGKDFIFGHPSAGQRASSTFRHPNDFGAYLVLMIPIALSFILYFRDSKGQKMNFLIFRIALVILLLISLLSLGFTYSRGAWIGFTLAIIVLGLTRKKILVLCIAISLIFLSIFSPLLLETRQTKFLSYNKSEALIPSQGLTESEAEKRFDFFWLFLRRLNPSGRSESWREASRIISDHPFLGTGINTYSQEVRNYKIVWGNYAHNCYLQMAAEIGLFGLCAFLWVIFRLFKFAWTDLRRRTETHSFEFSLFIGSLAGLSGFLLHSFVDTNFYSVQLGNFMWLMMGMIVACAKIKNARNS